MLPVEYPSPSRGQNVTPPAQDPPPRSSFPTTHWSVVLSAGSAVEPAARASLETLCREYWYPLYAFIRREGRAHHEAEDLTQGFLARLLSTEGMAQARPDRGRFRTFLLAALRNHLTDQWRRAHAHKRDPGGLLPLELAGADQRFASEPADPALTPEESFDRAWALRVIERAVAELREEYAASGRGPLFAVLSGYVWGDNAGQRQASLAMDAGLTQHAFTVAVSRLRGRLRERLRAHIRATVASESDAADELRHLLTAVRLGGPR